LFGITHGVKCSGFDGLENPPLGGVRVLRFIEDDVVPVIQKLLSQLGARAAKGVIDMQYEIADG
jgi:hypothetical protein